MRAGGADNDSVGNQGKLKMCRPGIRQSVLNSNARRQCGAAFLQAEIKDAWSSPAMRPDQAGIEFMHHRDALFGEKIEFK